MPEDTVHLFLKTNGTMIEGEGSQTSLGRKGSIECASYRASVAAARDAGSGVATGRRHHEPIVFMKRIDKSSPLLAKALVANEAVEATFLFFRPSPTGDGTTEQFYTVAVKQGRIAELRQVAADPADPGSASAPLEEVHLVFGEITWTYTNGEVTASDSLRGLR